MSQQVRLCMIGAGGHAQRNIYPSLFRLDGADITAACDLDVERLRTIAKRHGIPRTYTDYHEMIQAETPDGIIVCIGPAAHAKLAEELLDMGLHVYTEKPNAPDLAGSQRVVDAQRRSGKVAMVAYKKRFAPAYQKAKSLIEAADFGRPLGLNIIRSSGCPSMTAEGLRHHLLDWTCHTLDLACYLLGPVASVTARLSSGEQYAVSVVLAHHDNAVSHQFFTNGPAVAEEEVYIVGSGQVTIRVDNSIELIAHRAGKPFDSYKPSFTQGSGFSDIEQGFAGELQAFVTAIRDQATPDACINQATHTMAVFDAMWESMHNHQTVDVEYQP